MRLQTPQTMAGVYARQRLGERLVLGVRFLSLSNDLEKLRQSPAIALSAVPLKVSRTAAVSALYKISTALKWYGEGAISQAVLTEVASMRKGSPISITTGPVFETGSVTFRANYVYQTASYLPLLGYYLGDRKGPFAEVRIRPFSRLEFYGSLSDYTNNVARDPRRPTFRTHGDSAGSSIILPARFSLNAQWSAIRLASRKSDDRPWENAASEQLQLSLSRPIGRHGLRLAFRDLRQVNLTGSQRQRTIEVADNFQYRWFSLGGEVRGQELVGDQSKKSLYVRGNGQINLKQLSAYVNLETGSDLANRTLFITNTVSTTVLGGSLR
jgi:hypothetical protein